MNQIEVSKVLNNFLQAKSDAEVEVILNDLGDGPNLEYDQKFGPFNFTWHPYGNNASNISVINIGTKPGRSLTERITNAIDAILEARVVPGSPLPLSPQEAALKWFQRPLSEPDNGLFKMKEKGIDRKISVILLESGKNSYPTIDVIDQGVGIEPCDFSKTILSLHQRNKITSKHLMGAFGQGGSSTIAFSKYVLIVSRKKSNPTIAGFTLIKLLPLSEAYKDDCFVYLCAKNENGELIVPFCNISPSAIPLYTDFLEQLPNLPEFDDGTLIRHFNFRLTNLENRLSPSSGNLYHYLHCSLFDTLLPFRLIDLRTKTKARDELVTGNRNRLMKLVTLQEEDSESRVQIRHHRPMEYHVPLGSTEPCIGIEYWVVHHFKKINSEKGKTFQLRHSHETFAQKNHPLIATVNGQNQGELPARLIKDAGFPMISRHIVIHVDATASNKNVRRELFSSTREGLIDGYVLEELKKVITEMLKGDDVLWEIEQELTKKMVDDATETTSEEVKKQVSKLLIEAGLELGEEGTAPGAEDGQNDEDTSSPSPNSKGKKGPQPPPIPPLPFDNISFFKISRPTGKLRVRMNGHGLVAIETDGAVEFDKKGLIGFRAEPALLEKASESNLSNGRKYWRVRPSKSTKEGDHGVLVLTITKLDGTQLKDSIEFEIIEVPDKKKTGKRKVPPFKIVPIDPDHQDWLTVWPNLEGNENSVAYKPEQGSNIIFVYYSTIFPPYQNIIEKYKTHDAELLGLFKCQYEIWIGYHAILQRIKEGNFEDQLDDEELLNKLLDQERSLVAEMQAKQALETAKMIKTLKKKEVSVQ